MTFKKRLIATGCAFALPHALWLWMWWLYAAPLERGEIAGSQGIVVAVIAVVLAFATWVNTDER